MAVVEVEREDEVGHPSASDSNLVRGDHQLVHVADADATCTLVHVPFHHDRHCNSSREPFGDAWERSIRFGYTTMRVVAVAALGEREGLDPPR